MSIKQEFSEFIRAGIGLWSVGKRYETSTQSENKNLVKISSAVDNRISSEFPSECPNVPSIWQQQQQNWKMNQ